MKIYIAEAVLTVLFPVLLHAQQAPQDLKYVQLQQQVELHQGTPKVWPYLRKYLETAKSEGNAAEIVSAYKEMLHECGEGQRLAYADSMIMAAKASRISDLIGASYLTKGVLHYQRNEHQLALDNYISANQYLLGSGDAYLRYKVKYSIAQIKSYLGYYHEAIALFRECIMYFKEEDSLPYLKSLHGITVCYILTDNLELATQANSLALGESARLGVKDMLPYIESARGIMLYKHKEYRKAIAGLSYALPLVRKDADYPNEAIAHFFLGKAYWDYGLQEKAIANFRAVDSIFVRMHYIRPELRQGYEYLIRYYHGKRQRDAELRYINQLLKADSLLEKEFRYLARKIHKDYDTAELLHEKKKIQSELVRSRYAGIVLKCVSAFLIAILIYLVYRQRALKKIHRKRFEVLMNNKMDQTSIISNKVVKSLNRNPVIVSHISSKIRDFEQKKGYLKKDLNATRLAESFGTNEKYLREVVKAEKQKGFTNYINDLRIDYILARLKAEPLLRRYTNGALAAEAGFSTSQHFTAAFKKRTGITPGYFITEFEKDQLSIGD